MLCCTRVCVKVSRESTRALPSSLPNLTSHTHHDFSGGGPPGDTHTPPRDASPSAGEGATVPSVEQASGITSHGVMSLSSSYWQTVPAQGAGMLAGGQGRSTLFMSPSVSPCLGPGPPDTCVSAALGTPVGGV